MQHASLNQGEIRGSCFLINKRPLQNVQEDPQMGKIRFIGNILKEIISMPNYATLMK